MKEFNLEAALNGEPVRLRGGLKAIVYYRVPDEFSYPDGSTEPYPLLGIIFNKDGTIRRAKESWKDSGAYTVRQCGLDIFAMWEEPKISIEDLPKPFYPEKSNSYFYISDGKVAYNPYHSKRSESSMQIARNGQSFRTREDAQKWLDFMKSMME